MGGKEQGGRDSAVGRGEAGGGDWQDAGAGDAAGECSQARERELEAGRWFCWSCVSAPTVGPQGIAGRQDTGMFPMEETWKLPCGCFCCFMCLTRVYLQPRLRVCKVKGSLLCGEGMPCRRRCPLCCCLDAVLHPTQESQHSLLHLLLLLRGAGASAGLLHPAAVERAGGKASRRRPFGWCCCCYRTEVAVPVLVALRRLRWLFTANRRCMCRCRGGVWERRRSGTCCQLTTAVFGVGHRPSLGLAARKRHTGCCLDDCCWSGGPGQAQAESFQLA